MSDAKKEYDFGSYEKDALTRPRDAAWDNWVSWKDKQPGDKIQGYVRDAFFRPEELNEDGSIAFRAQRGITLEQLDGTLINVGVKYIDFILKSTDNLRVGDPLTIVYEKDGQKKNKTYSAPKIYGYYGKNLETTVGNPTVKELTDEDRRAGGSAEPVQEDETEAEVTTGVTTPQNDKEPF